MKCSRRDLGFLLPALVAAGATRLDAQQAAAAPAADNSVEKLPVMKTQQFMYDELPVTTNGKNQQRRMFTAKTHTGFKMESHSSDIAPGEVNHPPHQHLREEMMLVREGTMELTINGKPYRLGPGRRRRYRLERDAQREERRNHAGALLHRQHRSRRRLAG